MAWSVKQQVEDASTIERVTGIVKAGTVIYTSGYGYDSTSGLTYFVNEKRNATTGALTWQQGAVGTTNRYPLCCCTESTRVYTGGYDQSTSLVVITARLCTDGSLSWTYAPAAAADGVINQVLSIKGGARVYVLGHSSWSGLMQVTAHNSSTGAILWYKTGGSGELTYSLGDLFVYGGYVYSCGGVSDGGAGYIPRVEKRSETDGTLSWEIEDAALATSHQAYERLVVSGTDIYIISSVDIAGSQDHFTLRKLSTVDGSTTWSVDVTVPTGLFNTMGSVTSLLILDTKLYIVYSYNTMPGTCYAIESRLLSDGSYIARDTFTANTELFLSIAGTSNSPAADEIIAVGSYPQDDLINQYSYFYDFLASTGGGSSLTLSLADGIVFSDSKRWVGSKALSDGVTFADAKALTLGKSLSDGIVLSESKAYAMSKSVSDGIVVSETATATLRGIWTKIYNLISSDNWNKLSKVTGIWTKKSKSSGEWTKK